MRKQLVVGVFLMSAAGVASAGPSGDPLCEWLPFFCPAPHQRKPLQAPEIDASSAIAAMTLLGGGLAVLRGRRLKKSAH